MKIKTRLLGEVEIDDEDIIVFPDGILGFEESRKFILLDIPENDVYKVLQDTDNEFVSFVVINPWVFFDNYEIDIPDDELLKINIRNKEQLAVMNIVTMSGEFEKSTVNLLAPVFINAVSMFGRQYVLNNGIYRTRHPLFQKAGGEADAGSK